MLFKRQWWPTESSRRQFAYSPSQPNSFSTLHAVYGTSCFCFNQTGLLGVGEMARQLRALAVLAEDLRMDPSIHIR